jgi:hypothetical protein
MITYFHMLPSIHIQSLYLYSYTIPNDLFSRWVSVKDTLPYADVEKPIYELLEGELREAYRSIYESPLGPFPTPDDWTAIWLQREIEHGNLYPLDTSHTVEELPAPTTTDMSTGLKRFAEREGLKENGSDDKKNGSKRRKLSAYFTSSNSPSVAFPLPLKGHLRNEKQAKETQCTKSPPDEKKKNKSEEERKEDAVESLQPDKETKEVEQQTKINVCTKVNDPRTRRSDDGVQRSDHEASDLVALHVRGACFPIVHDKLKRYKHLHEDWYEADIPCHNGIVKIMYRPQFDKLNPSHVGHVIEYINTGDYEPKKAIANGMKKVKLAMNLGKSSQMDVYRWILKIGWMWTVAYTMILVDLLDDLYDKFEIIVKEMTLDQAQALFTVGREVFKHHSDAWQLDAESKMRMLLVDIFARNFLIFATNHPQGFAGMMYQCPELEVLIHSKRFELLSKQYAWEYDAAAVESYGEYGCHHGDKGNRLVGERDHINADSKDTKSSKTSSSTSDSTQSPHSSLSTNSSVIILDSDESGEE